MDKAFGAVVTFAAILVLGAFLGGWLFMLFVGVVHGEWLPMMPTIGFWSAVKVSAMLSIVVGFANGCKDA